MVGIVTKGVTNNIPKTQCMAIPNAKFLLRNKVRSINGFFLVRLWAKNIHAKINARKHSAVISRDENHSSRSPRSSNNCIHAIVAARLRKPIQSMLSTFLLGASGLTDFKRPKRAKAATGINI